MIGDDTPKNDSEKLRLLAQWFDVYDFKRKLMGAPGSAEVQDFLRDLADRLEEKWAEMMLYARHVDRKHWMEYVKIVTQKNGSMSLLIKENGNESRWYACKA